MIDWTASKNDWISDVRRRLIPQLRADARLIGFNTLEANFDNSISAWHAGTGKFRQVVEMGNELAVAAVLLQRTAVNAQVHYERRLLRTPKSIDFCVVAANGRLEWIDVKTVAPTWQDDDAAWLRFEAIAADFPDNARLVVDRDFGGAAIAGHELKSRWSFLQRTVELESKQLLLDPLEQGPVRLLLCCRGEWEVDALEDFADFYHAGCAREDDWARNAIARYMAERAMSFRGTLAGFCFLKRRHEDVFAEEFAHDVRGPGF